MPKEKEIRNGFGYKRWMGNIQLSNEESKTLTEERLLAMELAEKQYQEIEREHEMLAKGRSVNKYPFILGWLTSFCFIGVLIGYSLAYSKIQSIFTRESFYKYDTETRSSGRYLFFISIVASLIVTFFLVTN